MNNVPQSESKSAFAKRIGVSPSWVSQLVARGLPLTPDGRKVLVADAIEWLKTNVAQQEVDGTSLADAKTRLVMANALRAELALERERGSQISVEEVRAAAREFGRLHRDAMLNFANRFGPAIAAEVGCEDGALIAAISAKMREALQDALTIPTPFQRVDQTANERDSDA